VILRRLSARHSAQVALELRNGLYCSLTLFNGYSSMFVSTRTFGPSKPTSCSNRWRRDAMTRSESAATMSTEHIADAEPRK
jgi:hypothetical protein